MWTKMSGGTKWHFHEHGLDTKYVCGIQRPCHSKRLIFSQCVMFDANNTAEYPPAACVECLRFVQSRTEHPLYEVYKATILKLQDQPVYNLRKPLDVAHKRLLVLLDGFVGGCYNDSVRNYGSHGVREADGRHISIKSRFINADSTERIVKGDEHQDIWRWIDPEDSLFDPSFDEKTIMSGHYKLGFRKISVYYNLFQVLMFMKVVHRLDASKAAGLKYDFQIYNASGTAVMGTIRREFLDLAVSMITNAATITFTYKDGTTTQYLSAEDALNDDLLLTGTLISGENHIPIYRNFHKALCFMEHHLGLKFEG